MATIVAFHAHPDDEALLTGGTLARLADEGHRVVIVTATDGFTGAAADPGARTRLDELAASAAVLGAARVTCLGYADSGHGPVLDPDPPAAPGAPARVRFARADTGQAAGQLAAILRAEHADLLLGYDAHGGYGHRDHVQVHRVGARAAALAGVRLLEATIPRELAAWLAGLPAPVGDHPPGRCAPVRGAQAGGAGRASLVPAGPRPAGPGGPARGRAAAAGLRPAGRPGVVRRAGRRAGGRAHRRPAGGGVTGQRDSAVAAGPVRVRVARLTDDAALAELEAVAWTPESGFPSVQARIAARGTFFDDASPPQAHLVAEADGNVAGYLRLKPATTLPENAHVLQVQGLAVHPAARRRGVAAALLTAAVAQARERGARKLTLRVLGSNGPALALYERLGFTREGVLAGEFFVNGGYVDDVLMARPLAPAGDGRRPEPGGKAEAGRRVS